MIDLPSFEDQWRHENGFYLTSSPERTAKILSHWSLYQKSLEVPGEIVECGVFKGASLIRLATFRHITSIPFSKKVIGFDTFGEFPETEYEGDIKNRDNFVDAAGSESISVDQLSRVLSKKGIGENTELVKGDINNTVPEYVEKNQSLRISFLHIDVDIYEPTVTIMDSLFERVTKGGLVVLDDYGDFDGESTAVEEYIQDKYKLRSMPHGIRGAYLVK
jgi:hypothetical protein